MDNKKIEFLIFDMILHFKFIYNPKINKIVTIQTVHLIVLSPYDYICLNHNSLVSQKKVVTKGVIIKGV
jgi:hypothetical protein